MKRFTLLAASTVLLLSPLAAEARPIGNPRNLAGHAPAAVRSPEKKAGLLGFLFRKNTAPPKDSKIVPRRGKQTPGTANNHATPKPKSGGLLGKLFSGR